jgi:anaerobic magnesium-protoporphyrin IX monomethyl ester cyclase
LDLLSKTIKPSISREAVQNMKKVGIRPLGFFMVGSPGETLQTILRTILFSITLGLDYAQFSRTIAKPRSQLHRDLIESSGSDYWRDYVLGNEAERRISNTWTELSEKQIDFMTKLAYYVFYYRPTHIIRSVSKVRSWEELSRSVRTAVRMLLKWRYFDE